MPLTLRKGLEEKLLKLKSQKKGIRAYLEAQNYNEKFINQVVKLVNDKFNNQEITKVQIKSADYTGRSYPYPDGPVPATETTCNPYKQCDECSCGKEEVKEQQIELNINDSGPFLSVSISLGYDDNTADNVKTLIQDSVIAALNSNGATVDIYNQPEDQSATNTSIPTGSGHLDGILVDLVK